MNFLEQAAKKLLPTYMPAGIPLDEDQLLPRYDGFSIANIPASLCGWLGCPMPNGRPLDKTLTNQLEPEYQHVILVVVDGLGLSFLDEHNLIEVENNPLPDWQAVLKDGLPQPLTSIVPSTTAAALTTFWSGRLPAEHGIIGYELFLREYGLIANMVTHSVASFMGENGNLSKTGFDPQRFLPVSTLGAHFKQNGIGTYALQPAAIANSGLSQMLLNGTQTLPYQSLEELWRLAADIPARNPGQRTYTYIYWSEIDTLSHHTGPQDAQLLSKWREFSNHLARFLQTQQRKMNGRTLLLLTADHGQVPTPISPDFDLHNHLDFTRHLVMMPSGESRLPYLFIKPGHEDAIHAYLQTHWEGQFRAVPSEIVIRSGLLGNCPLYDAALERMGHLVVFPKKNAYWWWANKENHLLGRHGGISRQEMLVPLFSLAL
jgi:predicted AlkP superfamily pyrophosphatase or phosphodiesterase